MATANEELLDATLRHQIYLLRLSGSVRDQVIEILDATEGDLRARIESRLGGRTGLTPANLKRLELLEKTIRVIRGGAWSQATRAMLKEMLDLANAEPAFFAAAVKTVSPVVLDLALPDPRRLRAIVETRPFEGRVLRDWAKSMETADLDRIMGQIRIGMVQGDDSAAIARRVFGTRALGGRDGVTEITRRQAAAVSRTAVNAISNAARREMMTDNSELFSEERYVATLDARTTPVCRSLDGKQFKVGEGPIPPLHFSCRSTRVAVLDGVSLGERPARSATERQLVREYNKANGTSATSRQALPRGHKGSFDEFKRKRVRELTGRVPGKTTYGDWLGRQSREFQDDVLGQTRAKLFRTGELKLDKFVNRNGDQIPLRQLARKEASAFRAAGLDPEDFY